MTFQKQVFQTPGSGVPGERYDNSPWRAQPFILNSASAANNIFGRGFSVSAEGVAVAGNPSSTNRFAGILVNPKEHALYGTTTSPLAPSLAIPNNVQCTIAQEGQIFVYLDFANQAIGNLICYSITTGLLASYAPGAAVPPGFLAIDSAVITRVNVGLNGLAIIHINNTEI